MSVQNLKQLADDWYNPEDSTESIEPGMNEFFDHIGFTDEYIQKSSLRKHPVNKVTVVKDSLWGLIEVDDTTLPLLNSPILQRLRFIRQLGFTYLVYPSAEHSRFTHSVGVYAVINKFLDAIEKRRDFNFPTGVVDKILPPSNIRHLRHAAILHDCGHLPFSHSSEAVFEANAENFACGPLTVAGFKLPAEDGLGVDISLSECLSLAIVLSPRFQKFYKVIGNPDSDEVYNIAALIAGLPIVAGETSLPSLISSGLDADKIDYLRRDAEACGIPLGIDDARMFLRSSVLSVPPDAFTDEDSRANGHQVIFAVNASGIDTFEEIVLGRAMLYLRVYFHKVTRNAERIFAKAFESYLDEATPDPRFTDILKVLQHEDLSVLHAIIRDGLGGASKYANMLLRRMLPRRAGVFGQIVARTHVDLVDMFGARTSSSIMDADVTGKELMGGIIRNLQQDKLRGKSLRDFERNVLAEAEKLYKVLKKNRVADLPASEKPNVLAIIPIPDLSITDPKNCYILESDGTITNSSKHSNSTGISDAAEFGKAIGYVYTDDDWRIIVFIALRNVLYTYMPPDDRNELGKIDLKFHGREVEPGREKDTTYFVPRFNLDIDICCRRCGINKDDVLHFIEELTKIGTFDPRPRLAPLSSDVQIKTLREISEKFEHFLGVRNWRITENRVKQFICQFRPALRSEVADLLKSIIVMDRTRASSLIVSALEKVETKEGKNKFLAPFSPTSGNLTFYFLEQETKNTLEDRGWTYCKSLRAALGAAGAGDTVLLVDDNVSSGSQATSQFYAWAGISRDDWPARLQPEKGIDDSRLTKNEIALLRKIRFGIAACSGTEIGATVIDDKLKELLKIKNPLGLTYGTLLSEPSDDERFEFSNELTEELRKIGTSVLVHCRTKGDNNPSGDMLEQCEADALGYGNLMGLVSSAFNAPTSLITALWCPGTYNDEPWVPLFIRRGYLNHLVLG